MHQKFFLLIKEKEEFFHTELVKHGVEYDKAAEVAKILVSEKPDELLTEQEIQLAKEVCRKWIIQHNRITSIYRK